MPSRYGSSFLLSLSADVRSADDVITSDRPTMSTTPGYNGGRGFGRTLSLTAIAGDVAGVSYVIGNGDGGGGGGGGTSAAGIAEDTVLPARGGYFNATGKVGWCSEDLDFTAPVNDPSITRRHIPGTIVKHKVGFTQVWV